MTDLEDISQLLRRIPALHRWFEGARREMPWRNTRDPYAIWVSEVMLQQTQVSTVVPYYERWIRRYPTLRQLADAPLDDVLKSWEGLGYYSRARNLHRAAQVLRDRGEETVPRDAAAFRALPGVGAYTTAAVMSMAYGQALATVDGNVRRVIGRLVALEQPIKAAAVVRYVDQIAADLLVGDPSIHNQSMMELGALLCTPKSPDCPRCPFASVCLAQRSGQPAAYPPRITPKAVPEHLLAVAVACSPRGELLIRKRPYEGFLGGLWELPACPLSSEADAATLLTAALAELSVVAQPVRPLEPVRHAYSHFKVVQHPWICHAEPGKSRAAEGAARWIVAEALDAHPLHRGSHKVLERFESSDVAGMSQQELKWVRSKQR